MSTNAQSNRRHAPRAHVCARALVMTEGTPAAEYMARDLSTGGIRLCGQPLATVGYEVTLLIQLPESEVRVRGQLLRIGATDGKPDFAVRFAQLQLRDEDAIGAAVEDALDHPGRRSLLLLQNGPGPWWPGWHWLQPVAPICATAITPLAALECIHQHPIAMGIMSRWTGLRASEWEEALPELPWRFIDRVGRLHSSSRELTFPSQER